MGLRRYVLNLGSLAPKFAEASQFARRVVWQQAGPGPFCRPPIGWALIQYLSLRRGLSSGCVASQGKRTAKSSPFKGQVRFSARRLQAGPEGYDSHRHRVGEGRQPIKLVALEANLRWCQSLISFWAPQGNQIRGV